MPRTKVPKNSKRNRDAANREEKINMFERKMDARMMEIDALEQESISNVDFEIKRMLDYMQTELREMRMCDLLEVISDLSHFSEFKASDQTQLLASMSVSQSITDGLAAASAPGSSRNDEEDTSLGGQSTASVKSAYIPAAMLRSAKALKTPGPLHSARARRARRSRSACGVESAKPGAGSNRSETHTSRSKMRTPLASRRNAFSADRTPMDKMKSCHSPSTPPLAFLRYPKPGEIALSKCGSPMVSQVMPDKFANVNIPIRNGVLSLRPKKLDADEVESDLLQELDENTLSQIKTLHANLQMIVNTASKAGFK